jgi:hypothetical protein
MELLMAGRARDLIEKAFSYATGETEMARDHALTLLAALDAAGLEVREKLLEGYVMVGKNEFEKYPGLKRVITEIAAFGFDMQRWSKLIEEINTALRTAAQ